MHLESVEGSQGIVAQYVELQSTTLLHNLAGATAIAAEADGSQPCIDDPGRDYYKAPWMDSFINFILVTFLYGNVILLTISLKFVEPALYLSPHTHFWNFLPFGCFFSLYSFVLFSIVFERYAQESRSMKALRRFLVVFFCIGTIVIFLLIPSVSTEGLAHLRIVTIIGLVVYVLGYVSHSSFLVFYRTGDTVP